MKKVLYILIAVILCASCNRTAHKSKTVEAIKKDSVVSKIDTTKTTFNSTRTATTYYGDTLKTKLIFPFSKGDSSHKLGITTAPFTIESNGIKINATLQQRSDGAGYDLDLNAIAKPKETVTTNNTTATENKGVAESNNTHLEQKKEDNNKDTHSEGFPFIDLITGVLLLLLIIFFPYHKFFQNGKISE